MANLHISITKLQIHTQIYRYIFDCRQIIFFVNIKNLV